MNGPRSVDKVKQIAGNGDGRGAKITSVIVVVFANISSTAGPHEKSTYPLALHAH